MDLRLLPDIFAVAVFILAFRPLVRRAGAHADTWFQGWTFLLVHTIAVAFDQRPGIAHSILSLIAIWSVDLCGLSFLTVAANTRSERIRQRTLLEIAFPVLLQSALFTLTGRWPAMRVFSCLLMLVPAAHLLISRDRAKRPAVVVSLAFLVFGAFAVPLALHNSGLVAGGALTILFLSSAYLYLTGADRITRGVIATVVGLVTWALTYPFLAVVTRFFPNVHPQHTLLALPQYLLAAGMLLSLLEEHVLRTERMAMHDPLTDLPNRRLFEERLIATMADARANKTTVACLVIDVDNFKSINDTLGHEAGDQLLRALATRLSWHMSPRDMLARTGGDEFTALLAGVNDEHHLRFIAGAMMSAASVPVMVDGNPVDVRISVGIALSPDDADDIDGLRRAADEAMYSAKRRGGSLLAFAGDK